MIRKVFSTVIVLFAFSLATYAQEKVKIDTVRTVSPVVLGDSTDLITIEQRVHGNWFATLSAGVNSIEAEANRRYDKFYERVRPTIQLSVGKWISPLWGGALSNRNRSAWCTLLSVPVL